MNRKDITGLALTAVNAVTGRYVSAAFQALRNWKAILGVISAILIIFVIIVSAILSMPGIVMQSILPEELQENRQALTTFAKNEISSTEVEKSNYILDLLSSLSSEEESAKLSGDEPSKDEILIIYNAKYGGYFDENKLDKKKIKKITKSFLAIEGLTVYVKPFEQVVNENGLTDEQKAIALNMYYSLMYDQTVPLSTGDTLKNFGRITYKNGNTNVVYYSQRDERWATESYGDGTVGRAGCGPTCLAMVISSLSQKNINPKQMCDWSYRHGFKHKGGGSYWSLIPDAVENYGLNVEGNVKEAQQLVDALADHKLIIAIMGPGHFTSSGHFIVLRGVTTDGKIMVADSYSKKNTDTAWSLETIINESKKGNTAGGPFWIISD